MPVWDFDDQASAGDYTRDVVTGEVAAGQPIGLLLALTFPLLSNLITWDNDDQSASPSYTPDTQN
jgi:hypothetical protein